MWYLVCWDRVVWLDCREACLRIKFLVRTAFNKQAPAYVHGVKTHGKTGFGADESREAEVRTALWRHFSPIGAVISWKKQRGLPKSVVDHCHGPCCVGKSFPKPSDWTWEFDRLGSDHRGGCVQWIVVTNRAINSGQVDRQYRRCQPSVASMWTRNGPSLHNLWKARKSDEIPNLSQIEGTELIKQSAMGESASCQPSRDRHFCLQMKTGSGGRPWSHPIS